MQDPAYAGIDRHYGYALASSGNTIAVGARGVYALNYSGAVYIFVNDHGQWARQARLFPINAPIGKEFGYSVAISGDTLAVSAYAEDTIRGYAAGAVYVFTREDGVWNQEARLTVPHGAAEDSFGLALSIEGDTLVAGSHFNDSGGFNAGAAYVFTRENGAWNQEAKLTAPDAAAFDEFGIKVALSGETVVIGSRYDDDAGDGAGSAYVFEREDGGWQYTAKLTASDAAAGDRFGNQVAIEADTILISATHRDGMFADDGAVYIFVRDDRRWLQSERLTAPNPVQRAIFGRALAVHGDRLAVSSSTGWAYAYRRNKGLWDLSRLLKRASSISTGDYGTSMEITEDSAIVGENGEALNGGAYVYDVSRDGPSVRALKSH